MSKGSFSDTQFWDKISRLPTKASCEIYTLGITLFVLAKDDQVPMWAKVGIVTVLTYFLCPVDAIPDFLPGGFVDDVVLMAGLEPRNSMFMSILKPKKP